MPFSIEDAKLGESKGSAKVSILVGFLLLAMLGIQPLRCCSGTLATRKSGIFRYCLCGRQEVEEAYQIWPVCICCSVVAVLIMRDKAQCLDSFYKWVRR